MRKHLDTQLTNPVEHYICNQGLSVNGLAKHILNKCINHHRPYWYAENTGMLANSLKTNAAVA